MTEQNPCGKVPLTNPRWDNLGTELRCYTFTLFQLSSIQQGIQSGHAATQLVHLNPHDPLVHEWAALWKTIVLLNGGDLASLKEWREYFHSHENPFAFEVFYESMDSLGSLPTSIAIVLPERIFGVASAIRHHELTLLDLPVSLFSPWELGLIERLVGTRMAV